MGDYNLFAEEYAKKTEESEEKTRNLIYSFLPNLNGKIVLDVGCGSGHDAVVYSKKGAKVFGIDVSEKEIEMARLKLPIGNFSVGSMENLPYASDYFDIITSVYALQASFNVQKSLNEMIRVTKKGGTILILSKHPIRNFLEGWQNDGKVDYFEKRNVTSRIFNRAITLSEPGHTLMEYLNSELLESAHLEIFEEHVDFPASEQIIPGLIYPTYFIMKLKKE